MNRLSFILLIITFSLQYAGAMEHEKFHNGNEVKTKLEKEILEYEEILNDLNKENAPEALKKRFEGLKKSYEELLKEYNERQDINIEEKISSIERKYNIFYNNVGGYY